MTDHAPLAPRSSEAVTDPKLHGEHAGHAADATPGVGATSTGARSVVSSAVMAKVKKK
jgi:hypothetical protein